MTISVIRVGDEIQVNQTTFDNQSHPKITALPDGWLVTWSSLGQDGSGSGIYMQKYNLQGEPQFLTGGVPVDRLVNTSSTTGDQIWSTATALSGSGGFVVTWIEKSSAGNNAFQQRYDVNGTALGSAIKINGSQPILDDQHLDIIPLPGGEWLTTWSAFDGNGYGVYQQRFNSSGVPQLGSNGAVVNTSTSGHQQYATVTMLEDDPIDPTDGGWVVTWVSNPDFQGSAFDPGADIFMRRYNASGVALGSEVRVNVTTDKNQTLPQVTGLPGGGWLVVWQSTDQDGSGTGIFMQRYTKAGAPAFTQDQPVNLTTQASQSKPQVQVLSNGGWVVSWESGGTVYQRWYDKNGSTAGPDLVVADPYDGSLRDENSSVTALGDGSWVVAWQSKNLDAYPGSGIMQRVFTQTGEAILTTAPEYAIGTADNDVLQVKAGGLSERDVVDGGLGDDTLLMIESGDLSLYNNREGVKGFETLVGSSGNDRIITDSAQIAAFKTIDGGDGTDELVLLSGWQTYDLTGKAISGIEHIVLSDDFITVMVDDADTALLVLGQSSNDKVELSSGTFTEDQRIQLFKQGVETIKDADGEWTNAAPVMDNINGDEVIVAAGGSASIDSGATVVVTEDTKQFGSLLVKIQDGSSLQDSLRIVTDSHVTVANGKVSVDGVEIGTIDEDGSSYATGLKIIFSAAATEALVSTLIHAISFMHSDSSNPVTTPRHVAITLVDVVGAESTASVTVFVTGTGTGGGSNTAPTIEVPPVTPTGSDIDLISPFAEVVVNDKEGQTLTVKITFDKSKGVLIPASGLGKYDAATGTFTFTGSAGRATDALNALRFDPTDRNGPVNAAEHTTFTISVDDDVTDGVPATTKNVTIDVVTANKAPVVGFSGKAVSELATNETVAGVLTVSDPNGPDTLTATLIGAESAPFKLVQVAGGWELRVKNGVALDYEQDREHSFTIRVTDSGGLTTDQNVAVSLSDVSPESTSGTDAGERIVGGAGKDTFSGNAGNDTLAGGFGNDQLKGDAGQDVFVFDTKPNRSTNKDKIVDFIVKDDSIWLDNAVFTKLGKSGSPTSPVQLKKDYFVLGDKAKDKNDYIIYDKAKGVLYYDADGSGKGKAVEIATLSKKLAMTYKDFFVI